MEATYTIDETNLEVVLTISEGSTVLNATAIDLVQMGSSVPLEVLEEYQAALRANIFEKISEVDEDFLDNKLYDMYNALYRVIPKLQAVSQEIGRRQLLEQGPTQQ